MKPLSRYFVIQINKTIIIMKTLGILNLIYYRIFNYNRKDYNIKALMSLPHLKFYVFKVMKYYNHYYICSLFYPINSIHIIQKGKSEISEKIEHFIDCSIICRYFVRDKEIYKITHPDREMSLENTEKIIKVEIQEL